MIEKLLNVLSFQVIPILMLVLPEKLLTVPQVAQLFGCTTSCVRRWILERRIAVVKLGRLVRVQQSEAEKLIAAGVRPAGPVRLNDRSRMR
jgi:excisionase family DNA binding protein